MYVVSSKKGSLINDAYSINLCFSYDSSDFDSFEDFASYYRDEIYYSLFSLYPDTAFSATAKSYYGELSSKTYIIIVEVCVNGMAHADILSESEQYSENDAEKVQLAMLINQLAEEADKYSQNRQKVEYVYNYLRANVVYGGMENIRAHTSYGALIDKEAVCQGYSMVIQDVCYILDIPCILNYSLSGNHGWNSIFLDGQWQFIDATNGFFLNYSEDEIENINPMYDFEKDKIHFVQDCVCDFYNLNGLIKGDADNDGEITSYDALFVLNYITGSEILSDDLFSYIDMNNDGEITSYDALLILQIVVY